MLFRRWCDQVWVEKVNLFSMSEIEKKTDLFLLFTTMHTMNRELSIVFKYLEEALKCEKRATKAYNKENMGENYTHASRAMSCAIAFEKRQIYREIYEGLNRTYCSEIERIQKKQSHLYLQREISSSQKHKERKDITVQDSSSFQDTNCSNNLTHTNDFDGTSKESYTSLNCELVPKFERNHNEIENDINNCMISGTGVYWESIVGCEEAVQVLKETVILPKLFPQLFSTFIKPWKTILLYGPPGTGKTQLARALAQESGSSFFSVTPADILSKWMGQSEKFVRHLFKTASINCPAIIFLDEVDSICSCRNEAESESSRRIKTEFLIQMQGIHQKSDTQSAAGSSEVTIVAATNLPWDLDSAILRRFERRIHVQLPDMEARKKMFMMHLGNIPHKIEQRDFQVLAEKTEHYSGSDISCIIKNALMEPIRELHKNFCVQEKGIQMNKQKSKFNTDNIFPSNESTTIEHPVITFDHLMGSIKKIPSSICLHDINKYKKFSEGVPVV